MGFNNRPIPKNPFPFWNILLKNMTILLKKQRLLRELEITSVSCCFEIMQCAGPVPVLCRFCAGSAPVLRLSCASPAPVLCRSCAGPTPVLRRSCAGLSAALRQSCEIMGAIGMFLQNDFVSGFSFKKYFTQMCPSPPPATPLSFDSLRNYTTVDLNRQTCQFWQSHRATEGP